MNKFSVFLPQSWHLGTPPPPKSKKKNAIELRFQQAERPPEKRLEKAFLGLWKAFLGIYLSF